MDADNTSNESSPQSNQTNPKKKPYRSKGLLSSEELNVLSEREQLVLPFALRQIQKRIDIPGDKRQQIFSQVPSAVAFLEEQDLDVATAISKYGCVRSFFYRKVAEYAAQMAESPDNRECWSECLAENRGRPRGASHVVTQAKRLATHAGVVLRERTGIHNDGSETTVALQSGIDILPDVHEFGKGVIEDFQSTATTRREVQRFTSANPAVVKFLTEGENALRRDGKPKMMFQIKETDGLWCWDFCDLPNYFNDNGIIATGVMLALIEMKHDVKLLVKVILKKELDGEGNLLSRTFRSEDAARFAATAMYIHNRRPAFFYNDRDPRFRLLEQYYAQLTQPGETPISAFSPPTEEPWPRGLLEGTFQRALHKFAARFYGKYNKKDRRTIRKAIENATKLPTTELYERDLQAYLEDINEMPRARRMRRDVKAQESRAAAYSAYINPRTCPPVRQLFNMPLNKIESWPVLDDFGFNFAQGGEEHFIPTVETEAELPDLYERWMDISLAKQKSHFYAIELDFGWVGEIYLQDTWYQVVPRSEFAFNHFQHDKAYNIAVNRVKQKGLALTEDILQSFLNDFGSLPKRLNTTYSGEYIQQKTPADQHNVKSLEASQSESIENQPKTKPSRDTTPISPKTKPTVSEETDWSDLF